MGNYNLGICLWGFPMQGPTGIKIAAEMGFQGVEIGFGDYENQYPLSNPRIWREYRQVCDAYSIALTALSIEHLNQYGLSNPMESRKGMIAMDGCRRGIETAAEMGIPVIQMPSFNDGAIRTEDDFKNTCEKLRILCEIAQEYHLIVATENPLDVRGTRRMMEEVGFDNFKLMFDSQNYYLADHANTAEVLRELHTYVVYVHLKDGYNGKISSALLGRGDTGFMETAQVILETECSEWLLLENYYHLSPLNQMGTDQFKTVEKDMEMVRKVFHI